MNQTVDALEEAGGHVRGESAEHPLPMLLDSVRGLSHRRQAAMRGPAEPPTQEALRMLPRVRPQLLEIEAKMIGADSPEKVGPYEDSQDRDVHSGGLRRALNAPDLPRWSQSQSQTKERFWIHPSCPPRTRGE